MSEIADLEQNLKSCNGLANFPLELICEILCRLPFESMLVSKAVCKTWYSATQHPGFLQKLLSSTRLILRKELETRKPIRGSEENSDHIVLVDVESRKARRIQLEDTLSGLKMMSTCDGLLCMAHEKGLDPVVICNPVTGESLVLPPSSWAGEEKKAPSWQVIGLGMDLSTNRYKVVRACAFNTKYGYTKIEAVTVGENSWRRVQDFGCQVVWDVAYCDGSLYWVFYGSGTFGYRLDLGEEKFHVIWCRRCLGYQGIVDMGGRLAVMTYEKPNVSLWWITGDRIGECFSFFLPERSYPWVGSKPGLMLLQCIYRLNGVSCLLSEKHRRSFNLEEELTAYLPEVTKNFSELDEITGLPGMPCTTFLFKPNMKSLPWRT